MLQQHNHSHPHHSLALELWHGGQLGRRHGGGRRQGQGGGGEGTLQLSQCRVQQRLVPAGSSGGRHTQGQRALQAKEEEAGPGGVGGGEDTCVRGVILKGDIWRLAIGQGGVCNSTWEETLMD